MVHGVVGTSPSRLDISIRVHDLSIHGTKVALSQLRDVDMSPVVALPECNGLVSFLADIVQARTEYEVRCNI